MQTYRAKRNILLERVSYWFTELQMVSERATEKNLQTILFSFLVSFFSSIFCCFLLFCSFFSVTFCYVLYCSIMVYSIVFSPSLYCSVIFYYKSYIALLVLFCSIQFWYNL